MYENSTYNKNNIPNKWEKDELFNRFVGEMANHLQKNLGPQCTPQVQIHSRGINPNIYFLTIKILEEDIKIFFIILDGESFPTYDTHSKGHNGKE